MHHFSLYTSKGIILYECTQNTAYHEEGLITILTNLREMKFPKSFKPGTKENALIIAMLSYEPAKRPTIDSVIEGIKSLNCSQGRQP